jgi:hypothetical protein
VLKRKGSKKYYECKAIQLENIGEEVNNLGFTDWVA